MKKDKKYLSASKIKVLQSCSWKYWCKYVLGLPEPSNDGSRRGSVCHLVFEVLGNPRHKKHFTKIIRKQDAFASEAVKRLVMKHAASMGIDDAENIEMVREMILTGLNYDFFGLSIGKPTKSFSELDFVLEKNEYPIRYNIVGFIDKLFLYKGKKLAKMRDYKTSAKVFVGGEIDDNLQDWIYSLAILEYFPEYPTRINEFPFLRHMKGKLKGDEENEGVVRMKPIESSSLRAFEYELSHYQQMVENFDENTATSNFAADHGFPTDSTFSGKLLCGFAQQKGQRKKDGSLMWHCPVKFGFDYISVISPEGDVVKNYLESDFDESKVPPEHLWVKMKYSGCPKYKNS